LHSLVRFWVSFIFDELVVVSSGQYMHFLMRMFAST